MILNRTIINTTHCVTLLVTLLLSVLRSSAMQIVSDGYYSPDKYPFVIVAEKDASHEFVMTDSLFDELATSVQFKVNRFEPDPDAFFIRACKQGLRAYLDEQNLQIVKMFIRGGASPEGPAERNLLLAQKRSEALADLLLRNQDEKELISYSIIPEDYEYLLRLMLANNDADYQTIKDLYDTHHDNLARLKQAMMTKRTLWNRLLAMYFPTLRAARVVLLCDERRVTPDSIVALPVVSDSIVALPVVSDSIVALPVVSDSIKVLPSDSLASLPAVCDSLKALPAFADSTFSAVDPFAAPELSLPGIARSPLLTRKFATLDTPTESRQQMLREPRREVLSVKTNLLFYGIYMPSGYDRYCPIPNVAIEYYPLRGHFTYGASFDCPWWQDYWGHKYFQLRNYQLETRYYFRSGSIRKNPPGEGAAFRGFYLQAYGHAGLYGIMLSENRGWMGEGLGGGLGIGYVLPLTKAGHWRLEFAIQAGYFWTQYDPFQWECPVDPDEQDHLYYYKWTLDKDLFVKRQYHFTWLGPTRVGITLSYDLLYRRIHKKGISFRKWERR